MKKVVKKVSAKPKPASVKKSAKKSIAASSPPKKKVAKKKPSPKPVVKKTVKKKSPATLAMTIKATAETPTPGREPRLYLERAGRVMTFSEAEEWKKANPPPVDVKPSFGSSVSISERATTTESYDRRYGRDGK